MDNQIQKVSQLITQLLIDQAPILNLPFNGFFKFRLNQEPSSEYGPSNYPNNAAKYSTISI